MPNGSDLQLNHNGYELNKFEIIISCNSVRSVFKPNFFCQKSKNCQAWKAIIWKMLNNLFPTLRVVCPSVMTIRRCPYLGTDNDSVWAGWSKHNNFVSRKEVLTKGRVFSVFREQAITPMKKRWSVIYFFTLKLGIVQMNKVPCKIKISYLSVEIFERPSIEHIGILYNYGPGVRGTNAQRLPRPIWEHSHLFQDFERLTERRERIW